MCAKRVERWRDFIHRNLIDPKILVIPSVLEPKGSRALCSVCGGPLSSLIYVDQHALYCFCQTCADLRMDPLTSGDIDIVQGLMGCHECSNAVPGRLGKSNSWCTSKNPILSIHRSCKYHIGKSNVPTVRSGATPQGVTNNGVKTNVTPLTSTTQRLWLALFAKYKWNPRNFQVKTVTPALYKAYAGIQRECLNCKGNIIVGSHTHVVFEYGLGSALQANPRNSGFVCDVCTFDGPDWNNPAGIQFYHSIIGCYDCYHSDKAALGKKGCCKLPSQTLGFERCLNFTKAHSASPSTSLPAVIASSILWEKFIVGRPVQAPRLKIIPMPKSPGSLTSHIFTLYTKSAICSVCNMDFTNKADEYEEGYMDKGTGLFFCKTCAEAYPDWSNPLSVRIYHKLRGCTSCVHAEKRFVGNGPCCTNIGPCKDVEGHHWCADHSDSKPSGAGSTDESSESVMETKVRSGRTVRCGRCGCYDVHAGMMRDGLDLKEHEICQFCDSKFQEFMARGRA